MTVLPGASRLSQNNMINSFRFWERYTQWSNNLPAGRSTDPGCKREARKKQCALDTSQERLRAPGPRRERDIGGEERHRGRHRDLGPRQRGQLRGGAGHHLSCDMRSKILAPAYLKDWMLHSISQRMVPKIAATTSKHIVGCGYATH